MKPKSLLISTLLVASSHTLGDSSAYRHVALLVDQVKPELANEEGIGPVVRTLAYTISRADAISNRLSKHWQLGIGYSYVEDRDPVNVIYENGIGEESSIEGGRLWGTYGVGKFWSNGAYLRAGAGAAYFLLNRDVKDCADCERERMNINLEPYAAFSAGACDDGGCLELEYRRFFSDALTSGVALSLGVVRSF